MKHFVGRPFAILSLLLVVYAILVLVLSSSELEGDEKRYLMFADNLTHGYYSPPDTTRLWNGPGYPIVLVPFAMFGAPWTVARAMNALFMFGAAAFCYKTLRLYTTMRAALFFSVLLGSYPSVLRHMYTMETEVFSTFLISGFAYCSCRAHENNRINWRYLVASSVFLGYLALTKVFFGWVILVGILTFAVLYAWKRSPRLRGSALLYILALVFCLPYLVYSFSLAGRMLYWGTSGGMSFYWMSSPYQNDLGDWHSIERVRTIPDLTRNHGDLIERIVILDEVQADEEYMRLAIDNITRHPKKFAQNWVANLGRMLFSYPFSYTPQKVTTLGFLSTNMFVVVVAALCVYPTIRGRRLVPHEVFALLFFFAVAFGGSSLVAAYDRQFSILIPALWPWMVFILTGVLRIEMRQAAGSLRPVTKTTGDGGRAKGTALEEPLGVGR